jgi:hypothetical protein
MAFLEPSKHSSARPSCTARTTHQKRNAGDQWPRLKLHAAKHTSPSCAPGGTRPPRTSVELAERGARTYVSSGTNIRIAPLARQPARARTHGLAQPAAATGPNRTNPPRYRGAPLDPINAAALPSHLDQIIPECWRQHRSFQSTSAVAASSRASFTTYIDIYAASFGLVAACTVARGVAASCAAPWLVS